jgi:hypothetical protein
VAGSKVELSANSLLNYLQVPILTEDGYRYVLTWDVYYTDSYVGTDNSANAVGHKEFRMNGPRSNNSWFTVDLRNDGEDGFGTKGTNRATDVGLVSALAINQQVTPTNITQFQPLKPQVTRFVLKPNRWIRYWVVIDQLTGYARDEVSLWVADNATAPTLVFDRITLDVPVHATTGAPVVNSWWLEQNSSYDLYRGARRDLVSYVRNFAVLRNPNLSSVLISPSGAVAPPSAQAPLPPTNLHLVGGAL